jgi:hypothetical protein
MAGIRYHNFDLMIIALPTPGQYQAHVINAPGGEAVEEFMLPYSDEELEDLLYFVGSRGRSYRLVDRIAHLTPEEVGRQLYAAVFTKGIEKSLDRSLAKKKGSKQGLRIRLRLMKAPKLIGLPWEYLYTDAYGFLAHSNRTPLVRHWDSAAAANRTPTITPPLKFLVVIANPKEQSYSRLNVQMEWQRLNRAFAKLIDEGRVRLTLLEEATYPALQAALQANTYHVFHFIGHGIFNLKTGEGELLFENDQKQGYSFRGRFLTTLLRDQVSLQLVVLNACEGARTSIGDPFAGVAQQLVRAGVPAVLAMQHVISDTAAIILADVFYDVIAKGHSVEFALSEARKALYLGDHEVAWGTPVLYVRSIQGELLRVRSPKTGDTSAIRSPKLAGNTTKPTTRLGKAPDQDQPLLSPIQAAIDDELPRLEALHRTDIPQFIDRVIELKTATDHPWNLESTYQQFIVRAGHLLSPPLQSFVLLCQLEREYGQHKELFRQEASKQLSRAATVAALEWAIIDNQYEAELRTRAFNLIGLLPATLDLSSIYDCLRGELWAPMLLAWPTFTAMRSWPTLLTITGICKEQPNPFIFEHAETDYLLLAAMDPDSPLMRGLNLFSMRRTNLIRRRIYRNLLQSQPTLAIGSDGSGKTGAALLTAYDLLLKGAESAQALPIYCPLILHGASLHDQVHAFAVNQARTVAAFLAADPGRFFASSDSQQDAMAQLLAFSYGSGYGLDTALYQSRVDHIEALTPLIQQLRLYISRFQEGATEIQFAKGADFVQLLATAVPASARRVYALIDIQDSGPTGDYQSALAALTAQVDQLQQVGYVTKCFIRPALAALSDPLREHFAETIDLSWSDDELRTLLENRILIINDTQGGSLQTLVAADHTTIQDLTAQIIRQSDGRPGRLLTIGRRLVQKCIEEDGRLSARTVAEIVREMDQTP